MTMNDATIKALEGKGFNRWQKAGYDRLYIDATHLGLDYDTYKTGNISSATFNGEHISNRYAGKLLCTKTYIDVKSGRVFSGEDVLKEAVEAILNSLEDDSDD